MYFMDQMTSLIEDAKKEALNTENNKDRISSLNMDAIEAQGNSYLGTMNNEYLEKIRNLAKDTPVATQDYLEKRNELKRQELEQEKKELLDYYKKINPTVVSFWNRNSVNNEITVLGSFIQKIGIKLGTVNNAAKKKIVENSKPEITKEVGVDMNPRTKDYEEISNRYQDINGINNNQDYISNMDEELVLGELEKGYQRKRVPNKKGNIFVSILVLSATVALGVFIGIVLAR